MKSAVVLAWFALVAGAVSVRAAEKEAEVEKPGLVWVREMVDTLKPPRYEGKPLAFWVARLVQAENDKDREAAATAIIAFGPDGAPAIPVLVELLKDRSENFRAGAATILGEMGPIAVSAVPALARAFEKSEYTNVQATLYNAMRKIKPPPDQVVPVLLATFKEDHSFLAPDAVGWLREIGPAAKAAVPELRKLLKKGTPIDRARAARALWSIKRDPQMIVVLSLLLGYQDGQSQVAFDATVTWEAVAGLGEVGPAANNALPQLRKKLADTDWRVREAAVEAIRKIDPEEGKKLAVDAKDGTVTMEGVGKIAVPSAGSYTPSTSYSVPVTMPSSTPTSASKP